MGGVLCWCVLTFWHGLCKPPLERRGDLITYTNYGFIIYTNYGFIITRRHIYTNPYILEAVISQRTCAQG